VLGKAAKNVSPENAMEYVLGYTAANGVSSRSSQFAQSQWSFSKGFDGACPIGKHTICLNMVQINNSAAGPTLVSPALIPDAGALRLRGLRNGEVLQDCGTE
jgi:2-keto-4-pentenoate hydratase/2-oxohepta-3-ene-1,7-dioic acid hydratase in catechol pathway